MPDVERTRGESLPGVENFLRSTHITAEMYLEGLNLCQQAMNEPPFVPSWDEFRTIFQRTPGRALLTPYHKERINRDVEAMIRAMERRAERQSIYTQDPEGFKRNVVASALLAADEKSKVKTNEIKIKWGLFNFAYVAKRRTFYSLMRIFFGESKYPSFLKGFFTSAGESSLLVVRSGSEQEMEINHEDYHSLQTVIGDRDPFNPYQAIQHPVLTRLIENGRIEPDDWGVCLSFLDGVAKFGISRLNEGLGAQMWCNGRVNFMGEISTEDYEIPLEVGSIATDNLIFNPNYQATDEQRVDLSFKAKMKPYQVVHHGRLIGMYAHQFLREKGNNPLTKRRLASYLTALPPDASARLIRATLLGRSSRLEKAPQLEWVSPLAQTLVTFASRKADPDIYSRAGERLVLARERIEDYVDILAQAVVVQKEGEIAREFGMDEKSYLRLRKLAVKLATGYVPQGKRGVVREELKQRLGIR